MIRLSITYQVTRPATPQGTRSNATAEHFPENVTVEEAFKSAKALYPNWQSIKIQVDKV